MVREEQPANPVVQADARNRAFRTLLQGLGLDVATAVVLVLVVAVGNLEWTPQYWSVLGLAVAKSVIVSGVSYFARLLLKPKV
jgi:hypothetical protein